MEKSSAHEKYGQKQVLRLQFCSGWWSCFRGASY